MHNTLLLLYSVGAQWTYTHHKKPLQSIGFLESVRLVASTDGLLHVSDQLCVVPAVADSN